MMQIWRKQRMNKMKWMSKKIVTMTLATLLGVGMFSTTAFAYADETAASEEVETIEEPTEEEEKTEEIIAYDPLTPDGNLDLVDDYGSPVGAGKQFITVVTKTGNYFYIIIDRDDNGTETVHFLNLVDESDLLALMEEEDVEEYLANQGVAAIEKETAEKPVEENTEEKPDPVEDVVVEEKEAPNVMPIIMLVIIVIGGCGFYIMMKVKDKKKSEQNKPDPDADYEDDSMYDFMEETETGDSDEEEMDLKSGEDEEAE
jgi:flagellar basal body-associated protein FliL